MCKKRLAQMSSASFHFSTPENKTSYPVSTSHTPLPNKHYNPFHIDQAGSNNILYNIVDKTILTFFYIRTSIAPILLILVRVQKNELFEESNNTYQRTTNQSATNYLTL